MTPHASVAEETNAHSTYWRDGPRRARRYLSSMDSFFREVKMNPEIARRNTVIHALSVLGVLHEHLAILWGLSIDQIGWIVEYMEVER